MARPSYFVVFIALLPSALCCGNIKVTLVEANNKCADGSTSVTQFSPDFGFTLSEDCVLVPQGCVEITKDVTSAEMHYTVSAGMITLVDDTKDGCELMKNATANKEIEMVQNLFQMPKSCPVSASKVCADGKTVPLAQYKDKVPFSPGTIKGVVVTDHKDAGKSCINFALDLKPKLPSLT